MWKKVDSIATACNNILYLEISKDFQTKFKEEEEITIYIWQKKKSEKLLVFNS